MKTERENNRVDFLNELFKTEKHKKQMTKII